MADVQDERPVERAGWPDQQADVSVLDLVLQYGSAKEMRGWDASRGNGYLQHDAEADALFDRITALLPQQPVQARSLRGLSLWHHDCGAIDDRAEQPGSFACSTLGCTAPWRPLLVGGTRAPERDPGRCPTCDSPQPSMHPAVEGGGEVTALCVDRFHAVPGRPDRCLCEYAEAGQPGNCVCGFMDPNDIEGWQKRCAEPQSDLIAQVMAELGVDRPEDVLRVLKKRFEAVERMRKGREHWREMYAASSKVGDEARAEVERLTDERDLARKSRDEHRNRLEAIAGWMHRDGHAAVRPTIGAVTGVVHALSMKAATPAQPDRLVLSLPEVPEGTVALVGIESGRLYKPDEGVEPWPDLHEILGDEGSVRVVLAPQREPRTWPKLDALPDDLRHVRGASGTVYTRGGGTGAFHGHRDGRTITRSLHALQVEDGPLEEVLDEPGGAR